jgi:hypothetical protein
MSLAEEDYHDAFEEETDHELSGGNLILMMFFDISTVPFTW